MSVVVHKEGLNIGVLERSLFGFKVKFNTVDENNKSISCTTIPMTEEMILKDWRYANEEEVYQYNEGRN